MLRGAAWNNNRDNLPSWNRNDNDPDNRNNNIGFRVVWVGASARRCRRRNAGLARWRLGNAPGRPEPRGHLNRFGFALEKPGKRRGGGSWLVGRNHRTSRPAFSTGRRWRFLSFDLLDPAADHSPDFVQLLRDEEELLLADPAAVTNESPKNPKLFEVEIDPSQGRGLFLPTGIDGFEHQFQAIEREPVHALAKGEAVTFG